MELFRELLAVRARHIVQADNMIPTQQTLALSCVTAQILKLQPLVQLPGI